MTLIVLLCHLYLTEYICGQPRLCRQNRRHHRAGPDVVSALHHRPHRVADRSGVRFLREPAARFARLLHRLHQQHSQQAGNARLRGAARRQLLPRALRGRLYRERGGMSGHSGAPPLAGCVSDSTPAGATAPPRTWSAGAVPTWCRGRSCPTAPRSGTARPSAASPACWPA